MSERFKIWETIRDMDIEDILNRFEEIFGVEFRWMLEKLIDDSIYNAIEEHESCDDE